MKKLIPYTLLFLTLTLSAHAHELNCSQSIESAVPEAEIQVKELKRKLPSEKVQKLALSEELLRLTAEDKLLIKKTEAGIAPLVTEAAGLMGSRYSGDYRRVLELESKIQVQVNSLKSKVGKNLRLNGTGKFELFLTTTTQISCLAGFNNLSRGVTGNEIITSEWTLTGFEGSARIQNSMRYLIGNITTDKNIDSLLAICLKGLVPEECRDLIRE